MAAPRPVARAGLILAPTRELVNQIDAALAPLAKAAGLRTLTVYGGVKPGPQVQALGRGVDIVVACPGRLEDHLRSGNVDLSAVAVTVLDEADHMADLGFLPGVKRIMDKTAAQGPATAVLRDTRRRRRRARAPLPRRGRSCTASTPRSRRCRR